MEVSQLQIHSFLLNVLEIGAILRKTEGSIFSPVGFRLYQVCSWTISSVLITSCTFYMLYAEGHKFMTIVVLSGAVQFSVSSILLVYNKKDIQEMLATSAEVFHQLPPNEETWSTLELQQQRSYTFAKNFSFLMIMNLIGALGQRLVTNWISGKSELPLEESCFGIPTLPCWFFQTSLNTHNLAIISFYFIIRKIVINLIWGYANILSKMIRDRPVYDDEKNDRIIFKLYCDYSRFAASFSTLFGLTALIEVAFTSIRCCSQSYEVIVAISNNDWAIAVGIIGFASSFAVTYALCSFGEQLDDINEIVRNGCLDSKWYENSPQSRKRLLPMLTLNQVPIRFQYRCYMYFNYEKLMEVLQTSYSLITFLANFM